MRIALSLLLSLGIAAAPPVLSEPVTDPAPESPSATHAAADEALGIPWAGVGGVTEPTPRRTIPPEYPDEARRAKVGASLVLQAIVRRDGSIQVEKLLGCRVWKWGKEPDQKHAVHCPALFQSVKQEVELGTYYPALMDGRPVDARFSFVSQFMKRAGEEPTGVFSEAERQALLPPEAREIAGSASRLVRPGAALPPPEDVWVEVRTKNFTVLANTSVDAARRVGERLEILREVLRRLYGGTSVRSPRPTRIYLFRDEHSFAPYTVGSNLGGYFLGSYDGNIIALCSGRESGRTLYHEYLHYFLANNTPHLPLWLNEGMAELYSTFTVRDRQVEIGLPLTHHRDTLRAQPAMALADLFAVTESSGAYNETERQGLFYAQSWALAHYFVFGQPELKSRLVDYLERLGRGEPREAAFGAAFDLTYQALAAQLDGYLRQGRFPSILVTFEELAIDPQAETRTLSRAESLAHLGTLLVHADPQALDGPANYFRSALELEPDLAAAHRGRGLLLLAQGDRKGALLALTAAIRLDPQDALARLVHARILLDPSEPVERPQADALAEAERLLREAVELDPERGDSHRWLGHALARSHSCEEGPLVLKRAWQMMPSDLTIAGDLARLLGVCGELSNARYIVDTFLVPYADPQHVRNVESFLVAGELSSMKAPTSPDDVPGLRAQLEALLLRTEEEQTRSEIQKRLADLVAMSRESSSRSAIGELQKLTQNRDYEKALAVARQLLGELGPGEGDADPSAKMRSWLSAYIDHLEVSIQVERAEHLADAGDFRRAIGMLDECEKRVTSLLDAPGAAAVRDSLTGNLRWIRQRQVKCWDGLYRQAVKVGMTGDRERAAVLVREVIDRSPDAEMVASARKVLEQLTRAKAP